MALDPGPAASPLRRYLYVVIFGTHTRAGRAFDVVLLWLIVLSVLWVAMDSVASFHQQVSSYAPGVEWLFTTIFTLEFVLRLICVGSPLAYARSFFGIVDVLSILPSYLDMLMDGGHTFVIVRAIRLLRIFRVLKLARHSDASRQLLMALTESWPKISVFLYAVLALVSVFGAVMYLIEGEQNGFTSIPQSIYWAIVTMTTVGYGDMAPKTPLGQAVSGAVMILGYAIIAVPTGIVSAQLSQMPGTSGAPEGRSKQCQGCGVAGHDMDAVYCKYCGSEVED